MFAADLSLPEGFEDDFEERRVEREERIAIVDEAYLPPPEHAVRRDAWWEDRPARKLDLPTIFPGSQVVAERTLGEDERGGLDGIELSFDPEGRHLGLLREWSIRPLASPDRPLARGMERSLRSTRQTAQEVVERMKERLRMRPDAWIVMSDGETEITYRRNGRTWTTEEKLVTRNEASEN